MTILSTPEGSARSAGTVGLRIVTGGVEVDQPFGPQM